MSELTTPQISEMLEALTELTTDYFCMCGGKPITPTQMIDMITFQFSGGNTITLFASEIRELRKANKERFRQKCISDANRIFE